MIKADPDGVKIKENNPLRAIGTATNENVVMIDREEHDKRCSRYSTICFLSGIAAIVIYGIARLSPASQ